MNPEQLESLRAQITGEWTAAKKRFEQAQQDGQAAMADALRAEGALRLLEHMSPSQAEPQAEGK